MASRFPSASSYASFRRPLTLAAAGALAFLGLGLLGPSACTLSTAGIDDGSSGGGSSTTTGTGGAPGCTSDEQCKDGNPCTDDLCDHGTCKNPNNDTIIPTDPNPCTEDKCTGGKATHTNVPSGTPCGTDLKCDASGICQCTNDAQCGQPTDCIKPTCDMAKGCVMVMPTDTLPDPTPNDCKGIKCDGMGHAVQYNEDADKPADDGVVCTDDVCAMGVGSHPKSAEGTACMGDNVCNAGGMCVYCTDNFGCPNQGDYCFNEAACGNCGNLAQDGDETDLNCGGAHCPTCADGKKCKVAGDCMSNNCNSGTCISCMDGVQNGSESDLDCGGNCSKCADGKLCNIGGDCTSGKCSGGKCVSCSDGIKNGNETDVDCGGSCNKCGQGKTCGDGNDCSNGKCADGYCCTSNCSGDCKACNLPGKLGVCTSYPLGAPDPGICTGGKLCDGSGMCQSPAGMATKAIGDACGASTECFNGNCVAGFCKVQNGEYCSTNWDCGSYICANNACLACNGNNDCPMMNTCSNGECKLSLGEKCKDNSDCQSNHCNGSPKMCNPN
ncbi:MAG: hypothetical protein U0359_21560 [Byssovorax sp.]